MTYRRLLIIVLIIGLAASALIAARRVRHEAQARNVEIVMDDAEFSALARSYAYDQTTFLRALRGAGLTSLAVAEELGSSVTTSSNAAVYAGTSLIAQSRISALGDPLLAQLARSGRLRADEMYLIAYDAATATRYRTQLALKFSPRAVRVLRAALPTVFAIRTQSDYFQSVGLGLPVDRMDLAKSLGLVLVPRLQNDERFRAREIEALVASSTRGRRVRTLVFFGLRNAVLGNPSSIDAMADIFNRTKLNFGDIETYDVKQVQAGSDELARKIAGHIVRVQAIAKAEQDKLKPQEIVERYLLGVRERNIRVIYLRPYAHAWDLGGGTAPLSIQATNVEIVKRLAAGIKSSGLRLGGASPIFPFATELWMLVLASLALPAMLLLLLEAFGIGDRIWLVAAVCLDIALLVAGNIVHHDMAVRKLLALAAGVLFPVAALATIAPAFRGEPPARLGAAIVAGLRVMGIASVVTLAGALTIVGLLSTPLTMVEVDKFTGVKLVLLAPPIVAFALFLFTSLWGSKVAHPARAAVQPVLLFQLVLGAVIVGGAYILQARSGNQSDIAPSSFELALRAHLTTILSVRPRFKEFMLGFPMLVLLPSLRAVDRQWIGWIVILIIGVGLGDVVDTFSHLHTPLAISLFRLVNGVVLGAIVGVLALLAYRRWR